MTILQGSFTMSDTDKYAAQAAETVPGGLGRDKYGFMLGRVTSEAAAMYGRPEGATDTEAAAGTSTGKVNHNVLDNKVLKPRKCRSRGPVMVPGRAANGGPGRVYWLKTDSEWTDFDKAHKGSDKTNLAIAGKGANAGQQAGAAH